MCVQNENQLESEIIFEKNFKEILAENANQ
jgi:hypothetical protein